MLSPARGRDAVSPGSALMWEGAGEGGFSAR